MSVTNVSILGHLGTVYLSAASLANGKRQILAALASHICLVQSGRHVYEKFCVRCLQATWPQLCGAVVI